LPWAIINIPVDTRLKTAGQLILKINQTELNNFFGRICQLFCASAEPVVGNF
jgi:hypothetical protein